MFRKEQLLCLAFGALSLTVVSAVEKEGDDPLDWLRNSIPGEPGTDYPIYASVPENSFSCDGLIFGGYYADPEAQCQAYHVCLQDPIDISNLYPVSFLCPNGTIFNQELFNCDWWYNVDCAAAKGLYGLAEAAFGQQEGDSPGDAGNCPAASPGSPAECAGAVSTCWSPGQRDTDCPSNGLCCFNGCSNTCGDAPQAQAAAQSPAVIVATTTTPGYAYDVPEVTFPIRPVATTAEPLGLYGPPARQGRAFDNRRNNRRQGRRVKDRKPVIFI